MSFFISPMPSNLRSTTLALITLLALSPSALADTFRDFQGKTPAEVQKRAIQAGFQYPESAMDCRSNGYCYQKWGRSN